MWPSLPMANHIADWANGLFIASLVVGVVSSFLIVWMSGVKEGYWEKDRTESAERVASLVVQGDQLRKDTAEANARAVEAQLALEKFKAPRILTAQQQAAAVAALSAFAGTPFDFSVNPTPEPAALMGQIATILVNAKWHWEAKKNLGGLQFGGGAQPASGLMPAFVGLAFEIDVSKTEWQPALIVLTNIFTQAGIATKANVANDGSADPGAIHIYIGAKP
jgi:hypothetical protein